MININEMHTVLTWNNCNVNELAFQSGFIGADWNPLLFFGLVGIDPQQVISQYGHPNGSSTTSWVGESLQTQSYQPSS